MGHPRAAIERSVSDVMTSPVVTVAPMGSHEEIIGLFARHGISALPVLDGRDLLIGIVTEHDLLHKSWPPTPDTTARRLMSSPVHTIEPDTPLKAAARLMRDRRIKRLPVVEAGRLIGILSRSDLLRAYLSDEPTRDTLLRRVLGVQQQTPPEPAGHEGDHTGEVDILVALIVERRPPLR